jgi:hypothetical protein
MSRGSGETEALGQVVTNFLNCKPTELVLTLSTCGRLPTGPPTTSGPKKSRRVPAR